MEKLLDKFRFRVIEIKSHRELSKHTKLKYAKRMIDHLVKNDGFKRSELRYVYCPRKIPTKYPRIHHTFETFYRMVGKG